MRPLAAALLLLATPVNAGPSGEPPERIRLQKEWLKTLGYFGERVNRDDTAAYRAARREFALDAHASADPGTFHGQLQNAYARNQAARGTCSGTGGKATACIRSRPQ